MDGTPLNRPRRQVTINRSARSVTGQTTIKEDKLITRDDGIVHYTYMPEADDELITITVSFSYHVYTDVCCGSCG